MPKLIILSPDGFAIHPTETYPNEKVAKQKFNEWRKNFKRQGYYSSVKFGRIHLSDLEDYCELKEVDE